MATDECVHALFNYISSIYGALETRIDLGVVEDEGEYIATMLNTNVANQLIEKYREDVIQKCGVQLDDELAEKMVAQQKEAMKPFVEEMGLFFGVDTSGLEQERKLQEREATAGLFA